MKALGVVLATLACLSAASEQAPKQGSIATIHGPTVIAFLCPIPDAREGSGDEYAEGLSDFIAYADKAEPRLNKAGIEFRRIYRRSFGVGIGNRVRTFRSDSSLVGYYLIAPGKKPHVEYGVMTDADLAEVANKYFGVEIPPSPHRP